MKHPWPEHIALVIPAYKAATLLETLLPKVLSSVPADHILVVDDASFDDTYDTCCKHNVLYTAHTINQGKGAALSTGFNYIFLNAPAIRWIITMDADGQHAPEDLPLFIEASTTCPSAGICIGSREMKPGIMPPARILSNRLTSFLLGLMSGIPVKDSQCGYRIYNVDFLKRIVCDFKRFEMETEIIMKAAFLRFPVTFITIQTLYLDGPSHISHFFDTFRWVLAVVRIRMQRRQIINNCCSEQV